MARRGKTVWLLAVSLALLGVTVACNSEGQAGQGIAEPTPTPRPLPTRGPDLSAGLFGGNPNWFFDAGWRTDFTKHNVPLGEIHSGGPGRDGIPPIDRPQFVPVEEADAWLQPREPVISLSVGDNHRAYPLQILIWHEIVNDTLGDVPVAVTFCPLCNTAIAFDRRAGDRVLDFGTTGNLRHSDLIMWDRQTESWWQQITGEAIVGELTGTQLEFLPAGIVSWEEFKQAFPGGEVLSRDTGHRRDYGRNPYPGYDDINKSPFLFRGRPDGRLPAMTRVVGLEINGDARAFPFPDLAERGVVHATVGDQAIVLFHRSGTASALDRREIAEARDVGTAAVYRPVHDGPPLHFSIRNGQFIDSATGSEWNLHGQAISGPLTGERLQPVVHATHFWFALAAFYPEVTVWQP